MGTKRSGGRTERLTEAERSFAQWRRTRRERIPERLWGMAVDAAMVGGASVTARRVRLNPTKLRERLHRRNRDRYNTVRHGNRSWAL